MILNICIKSKAFPAAISRLKEVMITFMEVLVLHRWSHMIQSIIFRLRSSTSSLISLIFSPCIFCLFVCNLLQFQLHICNLRQSSYRLRSLGLKDFSVLLVLSERLKLTLRTIFNIGTGIIDQGSQF